MMKTRLWINGQELDLDETIALPITYSQADAKQPENRKRSTSKSCKLPGTVVNNAFFASTYDMHITDMYGDGVGFDYDPTLRYPCVVQEQGGGIFFGSANLMKVVRKKRVNQFHVALYSEIVDIFQSLGDILVNELDWSAYNHVLSVSAIQNSWSASTGSGYVYGLVHYGLTQNLLRYKTNQLRPHIYIKEFVEKCFALSGKTVSSAFLNTTRMKKLVWGYGGGEPVLLDGTEVANRQANYTGDGLASYVLPHSSYSPFPQMTQWNYFKWVPFSDNPMVTMTLVSDTLSQFNQTTGELVVFNAGNYNLNVSGTFPVTYTLTDTGLFNTDYVITVKLQIFKNMALVSSTNQTIIDTNPGTQNVTFAINQALECNAGDVITSNLLIQTHVKCWDNGMGEELELDLDLNNTLVFNFTAVNSGLIDGDDVVISRFLPEMKAADLLKDVMTMFNMYMGDPDQNGTVVFEPIDKYFHETDDVDDWNDKIDRDEEMEIEPAANIEGKVYRFRWAEDRDYYKQRYFNLYGKDYGDYDYNVPSTFKKGEKLYQLKQAQSCPVQIPGTNIIIPMIVKYDPATNVYQPHKGKPRMYFFNGEISCDDWELENSDTGALTVNNVYPQFHHLDNLTTAGYDLNFGVPIRVFYTATTYTTINMTSSHHLQFLREITGRDSKILNAIFKLKPSDLYHNFMRRFAQIDGVLYRKNLVKDYLVGSNKKVKCELIKIVAGNSRSNYQVAAPEIFEPAVGNTGTVTTGTSPMRPTQKSLVADTSGGNVQLDFDFTAFTYKEGQSWDVVKLGSNTLTFTVIGGPTLSGETTQVIRREYDAVEIVYKQGQLYFN